MYSVPGKRPLSNTRPPLSWSKLAPYALKRIITVSEGKDFGVLISVIAF